MKGIKVLTDRSYYDLKIILYLYKGFDAFCFYFEIYI